MVGTPAQVTFAEVELGLEPRSIVWDVHALLGYGYHPALPRSLGVAPAQLPSPELCAAAGQDVGVARRCWSQSAGTDPEPLDHTLPLSLLHLSVSKSGTTNIRLVGLGGEDPVSAGGARGRGLASGQHPRAKL